jgi:rubrerythrin
MHMGDPFVGNVPRKISKQELIQALRVDIAGELEAITVYDAHAMATDDPRAKAILYSLRDEERQHVGELLHLMEILDPAETQFLEQGKQEVNHLLSNQGQGQPSISGDYMQAGAPLVNQQMQQISGLDQTQFIEQGPSHGLGVQQEINMARHPAMQTTGQNANPQMKQSQGLGQYNNPWQPRPGNFGHQGPKNW